MTGLHQLFPRVVEHLKDPGKSVADIASPEMDGKELHEIYNDNVGIIIIIVVCILVSYIMPTCPSHQQQMVTLYPLYLDH